MLAMLLTSPSRVAPSSLLTPAVSPVVLIATDDRSISYLLLRDKGSVSAKLGIVLKFVLWDCVLMIVDPEKTPKVITA